MKTVLITGAARRLGRVMALDFARMGWHVVVHYHTSAQDAQKTADDIRALGGAATLCQADLADEQAVRAIAAAIPGNWLCLVNNAALFTADHLLDHSAENWHHHHAVNIRAPTIFAQEFARHACRTHAEQDGLILNILDSRVWNLTPYFMSYTASKAGLWAMTQSWALALAPDIRVNALGPGHSLIAAQQTETHFASRIAAQPLPRAPTEAEFCAALRFFLMARSVTGQMIALDGGSHLGWVNEGRLKNLAQDNT